MGPFTKLWRSERGNTGVLFAFSAIPLIGSLGGAVDLALHSQQSSALQSSLDAASLSAARSLAEGLAARISMITNGRKNARAKCSRPLWRSSHPTRNWSSVMREPV